MGLLSYKDAKPEAGLLRSGLNACSAYTQRGHSDCVTHGVIFYQNQEMSWYSSSNSVLMSWYREPQILSH